MSDFKVEVMRIDDVVKHPDADSLWIVSIRGYKCIFAARANEGYNKGRTEVMLPYAKGDLVAYIPEGSVLPEDLLKSMEFWKNGKGTLSGKKGNRVKAVKLRGVLSQGIMYRIDQGAQRIKGPHGNTRFVNEGDDVAEFLGITKYEAPVPVHMAGEVCNIGTEHTLKFDIENIQKFPDVFKEGESVIFTEKLHGTFCALGCDPRLNHPDLIDGKFFAFSKGLGAQGLVFKANGANKNNIYQAVLEANIEKLRKMHEENKNTAFIVLGEIFGPGIQDLGYGLEKPTFRVFDMFIRIFDANIEHFFSHFSTLGIMDRYGFQTVPVVFQGKFSMAEVEKYRDGKTTVMGGAHVREGIVIKRPVEVENDPIIGRPILKAVSPDYILRKGNTTEYN